MVITLRALGSEIVKTLVLAGIGKLTIIDPELIREEDLGANLFWNVDDIGKNVQELFLFLFLFFLSSLILEM